MGFCSWMESLLCELSGIDSSLRSIYNATITESMSIQINNCALPRESQNFTSKPLEKRRDIWDFAADTYFTCERAVLRFDLLQRYLNEADYDGTCMSDMRFFDCKIKLSQIAIAKPLPQMYGLRLQKALVSCVERCGMTVWCGL
jgi:hypothetical protein